MNRQKDIQTQVVQSGDSALRFCLYEPNGSLVCADKVQITGWCLDLQDRDFKGMRVLCHSGKKITTHKISRKQSSAPLVLLFPDHPKAALSGFYCQIDLPQKGNYQLQIQYRFVGEEWQNLTTYKIRRPFLAKKIIAKLAKSFPNFVKLNRRIVNEKTAAKADFFSKSELEQQSKQAAKWQNPPLLSIILPTYNTPPKYLRQCLDSVLAQSYRHWQLCIADDCSPNEEVREILREYKKQNPEKIALTFRRESGHICAASNSALELASGEFCLLLDHDDMLPPQALFFVADAIRKNPQAKIIFSDEDKIDANNQRSDAYFKADFNYDLLLAQNCISHLGAYQTALMREIGGFRVGMHGSQDWDLALRFLEKIPQQNWSKEVLHIPRVLYHWRILPGSTSLANSEKPYASLAAQKAVSEHLQRRGIKPMPEVNFDEKNFIRLDWPLPSPAPSCEIIIPTRDRLDLLEPCLKSLFAKTNYANFSVCIVNNRSEKPETLNFFKKINSEKTNVRVIDFDEDFNYAALNNLAVETSVADFVCLLNNDITIAAPDWLSQMLKQAARRDIGAVGAKLLYPSGREIQHAGVVIGSGDFPARHIYQGQHADYPGQGNRAKLAHNYSALTAACLVIGRQKYLEIGGMDAEHFPIALNDIDFCLRLCKVGYRNLYTPYAVLYHHESASRADLEKKQQRKLAAGAEIVEFAKRHSDYIARDPASHPNFFT